MYLVNKSAKKTNLIPHKATFYTLTKFCYFLNSRKFIQNNSQIILSQKFPFFIKVVKYFLKAMFKQEFRTFETFGLWNGLHYTKLATKYKLQQALKNPTFLSIPTLQFN